MDSRRRVESNYMIQPKFKVAPPLIADKTSLKDYSSIIQQNMNQLFALAHTHSIFTTVPTQDQGNDGDIFLVNVNNLYYIYAKFPVVGWKSVQVM